MMFRYVLKVNNLPKLAHQTVGGSLKRMESKLSLAYMYNAEKDKVLSSFCSELDKQNRYNAELKKDKTHLATRDF